MQNKFFELGAPSSLTPPLGLVQQSSEWSSSEWKDEAGRHSVIQVEVPMGNWNSGSATQRQAGVGDRNLSVIHIKMNIPPRRVDVLPRKCLEKKKDQGKNLGNTNICGASGKGESWKETRKVYNVGRELRHGGVLAVKGGANFKKERPFQTPPLQKSPHSRQVILLTIP